MGSPHEEIYDQLADSSARLIVMHAIQGQGIATRETSDAETIYDRVCRFFEMRLSAFEAAGIAHDRLILDPGMGFFVGDTPEPSFRLLARLGDLKRGVRAARSSLDIPQILYSTGHGPGT